MKRTKQNGITLIALVITIIVLLILAGVSIATLTGENGILTRAQEAKTQTKEAEDIEKIRLAISEAQIGENGYQELNSDNLKESLEKQFEGENMQLTDNYDESFIINFDDTSSTYYIDSDARIIEKQDWIKISTTEELKAFRDEVNNGNTYEGKYIYLSNDIMLDINEEWIPIGTFSGFENENTHTFNGVFDGSGHEIDGIVIDNTSSYQGFFGYVYEGIIKNIGIGENSSINCGASSGSLIGASRKSKIINCYSNANIEGTKSIGGILGVLNINSEIINCYNSGSISGTINVGGVVGNSMAGKISNCYNTGAVVAMRPAGISGQSVQESTIENCYNVGNITTMVGDNIVEHHYGIVAFLNEEDEVKNCYYLNGSVNGGNDVDECKGVLNKSSEELKTLASTLGKAFKDDINNINNGYPVLEWQ